MKRPAISLIGPGKVGTALGGLARAAGYRVVAFGGRDVSRAEIAARSIGVDTQACSIVEAAGAGDLVFLTVSDAAIESTAQRIIDAGALRGDAVLVHCSGALTSEVLCGARSVGNVAVASFHPLQTFPTVASARADLPGSQAFLEGDSRALESLERFGEAIGVHCVRIETRAKVLYHAGAVIACNYASVLMDAALTSMEAAGIPRDTAWPALAPLVRATLVNVAELGPAAALTGPIQRGDARTVALHVRALSEQAPSLVPLYRTMGDWAVGLAQRSGSLDAEAAQIVREALQDESG